jgi:hypothetical protein
LELSGDCAADSGGMHDCGGGGMRDGGRAGGQQHYGGNTGYGQQSAHGLFLAA